MRYQTLLAIVLALPVLSTSIKPKGKWDFCADQHQYCKCSTKIKYGVTKTKSFTYFPVSKIHGYDFKFSKFLCGKGHGSIFVHGFTNKCYCWNEQHKIVIPPVVFKPPFIHKPVIHKPVKPVIHKPIKKEFDWKFCAHEHKFCECKTKVKYGIDKMYYYFDIDTIDGSGGLYDHDIGGFKCSNSHVGDPFPGKVKKCYCWKELEKPLFPYDPKKGGWTFCADEHDFCKCDTKVQYGISKMYYYFGIDTIVKYDHKFKGFTCDNSHAGDPFPGYKKKCYCWKKPETIGYWKYCSKQHFPCYCDTKVKYGGKSKLGKSSFIIKKTHNWGWFQCSNRHWGNPISHVLKSCYCWAYKPVHVGHKFKDF